VSKILAASSRHSCRQCQFLYSSEVSISLWLKFFQNRHISYVFSELDTKRLFLLEYLKYYLNESSYPSEEALLLGIHPFLMESHGPLWRMCSGTEWTDLFGSPDTKVITTIKSNSGLFVLLNLVWEQKCYTRMEHSIYRGSDSSFNDSQLDQSWVYMRFTEINFQRIFSSFFWHISIFMTLSHFELSASLKN
jgi:hypothetical protein